jgi:hypothetical protein
MSWWERPSHHTPEGLVLGKDILMARTTAAKTNLLGCGGKPVLQHIQKVGPHVAERQPHAKVNVRIDDSRRRFKNLRFRDYFYLDERPVSQGIDGIDLAPENTEVTDARAHARAGVFRKDFRRSNERKSRRATLLHGLAFRGLAGHFIPRLARRRAGSALLFACPSPHRVSSQIQ